MKALGALLLLLVFVVSARVLPVAETVLPADGTVRLLGIDPYFHLRQARLAVDHFPALPEHDLRTNYPWGRRVEGGGLYDVGIAAAALASGADSSDDRRVARAAAWSPVVLMALSFGLFYLLARRVAGAGTAVAACALWALYPGQSLARTLLGFADHHAAEIFLTLWVALAVSGALARDEPLATVRRWLPDLLRATPIAVLVFTWRGAPLQVLLVAIVYWLALSLRVGAGGSPWPVARSGWRLGSAALLLVAGAGALWPWLVVDTRLWAPLRLALALLAVAPLAQAAVLHGLLRVRVPGPIVALISIGGVIAGAVAVAGRFELGRELALILIGPKPELIREHAAVDWVGLWREVGPVGVLALLGTVAAFAATLQRRLTVANVVPWAFAGFFTVLWWRTGDYGYMPPAFLALAAAHGAALVLATFGGPARLAATAMLAVICLAPVWPLRWVEPPWPSSEEWKVFVVADDGWLESMSWLRGQDPDPDEVAAARPGYPAFGVTSAWDRGNLVSELGRQAPVFDRYPTRRSSRWLFSLDEIDALPLLCPWCRPQHKVRYVVIDAKTAGENFLGQVRSAGRRIDGYALLDGHFEIDGRELPRWTFGSRFDRSIASQLYLRDGDGLRHFRLVHESPHQSYTAYQVDLQDEAASDGYRGAFVRRVDPIESEAELEERKARAERGGAELTGSGYDYDAHVLASVKTFEVVPGAVISGVAKPGTLVVAQLDLLVESTGRRLVYTQGTSCDREGRFILIVPYPTEPLGARSAVSPLGTYRLQVVSGRSGGEGPQTASVSEAQVRSGGVVDVGRIGRP